MVTHVTASDRAHLRPAPELREDTYAVRAGVFRRVSWGSIFAGSAVALACQLVFTTLGAGIGLAAIEPAEGVDPGEGFAIGAGIWWLITGLISLFAGGMVAGRLAGFTHQIEALLHGLLTWSFVAVLGVVLLTTSAASLIGGAFGPLARGLSARPDSSNNTVVENTGGGLAAVGAEAARQLDRTPAPPQGGAADSRVNEPGLSARPAEETVDRQEADQAADVLAAASMWSFVALVLGAGAAAFGGMLARPPLVEIERATVG